MGGFWKFIRSKSNRERLAWLGGGAVVVFAGLWTAFCVFLSAEKGFERRTQINATCGSVGIAGPVSGATINAGGATNSNCATKPN
jgi:hypothetical protein